MRTVTAQGHKGMLMAELRALQPGEVLLARGYGSCSIRAAVDVVAGERRAQRVLFAIERAAGQRGARRDRMVVCGADPLGELSAPALPVAAPIPDGLAAITDPALIEALFAGDFEAEGAPALPPKPANAILAMTRHLIGD